MSVETPDWIGPAVRGAQAFWTTLNDLAGRPALGATWGRLFAAFGAVLAGFLVRNLVFRTVLDAIKRGLAKTRFRDDEALVEALAPPIKLIPVILGVYVAFEVLELAGAARAPIDRVMTSIVAFAFFWALVRLVDPVLDLVRPLRRGLASPVVNWLKSGLKGLFTFVGAAAILEEWGIEVGPILAGLGIFGVAVALGAQDLFKNLIAGVLILAERRFAPGDWILVDGVVEGTVETINFRSTRVRRFDKAPVFVPNAKLSDNAVTNFTRMTHRRIYWKIGLEYRSTAAQLREVVEGLRDYVLNDERFASPEDVSTFVFIDRFNDSSIDVMLYCFTKTTNWGEWLAVKQDLVLKVQEVVKAAGTDFAFPSMTNYLVDLSDAGAAPPKE